MNTTAKNILYFVLSTLLGGLLMWWIYRDFRWQELWQVFAQRTNYVWIAQALLAGVVANVLRSLRWRMLLQAAGVRIKVRRAVELVFISYLINAVTPRLGELTRSLLVRRGQADVSARALGTVVSEKLTDVCCLVLVVAAAMALRWHATLHMLARVHERWQQAVPTGTGLLVALGVVALAAVTVALIWRHVRRLLLNLWQGMASVLHLHSPWAFAGISLAIWACNFLQLYLVLPCFEALQGITLASALHLFAVASVGLLVPTPAGAGPWHFFVVKTLTSVYHVGQATAKSFAFVSHGLKTCLVLILGILGYAGYYRSLFLWWRRKH